MKVVVPTKEIIANDSWGGKIHSTYETTLEIETNDVGISLDHYQGYKRPAVTIEQSDVGKCIYKYTDSTDWQCWNWVAQK